MSVNKDMIRFLREKIPGLCLEEAALLADHTSFRIGGPAAMAFPKTEAELKELLTVTYADSIPVRILGAGTNVLAPDAGVEELVICLKDCLTGLHDLGGGRIEAMAGETLCRAAVFARNLGLTGLEFAHGIPGTVGGGAYMNAGAYDGEFRQVAAQTTVFRMDGTKQVFVGEEQEFSYRHSAFEKQPCVVVKTVFQLAPGSKDEIQAKMHELMERRRSSQPLELPSAGSTFKRPAGYFAGALIEGAGLKGKGVGAAQVSPKHAGFIVNLGGATAEDVKKTIQFVQKTVMESAGVMLEPEVRIW